MAFVNGTSPPTLSVVVVTYNSEAYVGTALRALGKASSATSFEVIVVDNASVDASIDAVRAEYPDATIVASPENLGFAAACNLAAWQARGDYLLFLNPDSETDPGAIDLAVEHLAKHPEVGVVGGRTRYADGHLNPTCCFAEPTLWSAICYATGLASVFRRSTFLNPEAIGGWDRDSDRAVEVITGCFALLRTPLFRSLGGFDERFFLYSEDTDLCRRVRDLGLQCIHLREVGLVHLGGRSDSVRSAKLAKVFRARRQYYDKHWSSSGARVGGLLIDAAVLARLAASALGPAQKRVTWQEIWAARDLWQSGARLARKQDATSHGGQLPVVNGPTAARPAVSLRPHSAETRARMTYRLVRHVARSARSGDRDFVRDGLESLARSRSLRSVIWPGPTSASAISAGGRGAISTPIPGPATTSAPRLARAVAVRIATAASWRCSWRPRQYSIPVRGSSRSRRCAGSSPCSARSLGSTTRVSIWRGTPWSGATSPRCGISTARRTTSSASTC